MHVQIMTLPPSYLTGKFSIFSASPVFSHARALLIGPAVLTPSLDYKITFKKCWTLETWTLQKFSIFSKFTFLMYGLFLVRKLFCPVVFWSLATVPYRRTNYSNSLWTPVAILGLKSLDVAFTIFKMACKHPRSQFRKN